MTYPLFIPVRLQGWKQQQSRASICDVFVQYRLFILTALATSVAASHVIQLKWFVLRVQSVVLSDLLVENHRDQPRRAATDDPSLTVRPSLLETGLLHCRRSLAQLFVQLDARRHRKLVTLADLMSRDVTSTHALVNRRRSNIDFLSSCRRIVSQQIYSRVAELKL